MKLTRRKFLKIAGITAVTALASHYYLNNENMKKTPQKPGKILADIHSHLSKDNSIEDILKTLSYGLTGLTIWTDNRRIISYEDAIQYPNVNEIDKGFFAEITVGSSKGYFLKTQEISTDHHILAVACKKHIEKYSDARKVVEEIHKHNGLAILNHPYVITKEGFIPFRVGNAKDEIRIRELCEMVDEIEIFNAQNINPTLGIIIPNMKKANKKAKNLAKEFGFKGIAASDAHRVLEQSKISGIYLPEEHICLDSIKQNILSGNFERHEQYVSRWSFIKGMFLSK